MPQPTPERLSRSVELAIAAMSASAERSTQSRAGLLGVSDVGHCREFSRRGVKEEPFSDVRNTTLAWLGTAIGDHFEQAFARKFTNSRRHVEVSVEVTGQRHKYILTGHPDILLPDGIIDAKTVNGLASVQRNGGSEQQEMQLHLYALGAFQMGLFREGITLEEVWVADVWIDRSGRQKEVHSNPHPFNPAVIQSAADWLDDVTYAVENNEEAERDKHVEWCAEYCERYTACRMGERDVSGIITAPHLTDAIKLLAEAREMQKTGKRLEAEAKDVLLNSANPGSEGIAGTADGIPVRVTWVNGTAQRKAHHRINLG